MRATSRATHSVQRFRARVVEKVTTEKSEGKRLATCVTAVTIVPYISYRRPDPIDSFRITSVRLASLVLLVLAHLGCASADSTSVAGRDSAPAIGQAQVALDTPSAPDGDPPRAARTPRLSPAADTLARHLTFVARNTTVLTAATRGGRWLVDLGRIDVSVNTPERLAAYREAVAALSPVRQGDTLYVYGPWGASRAVAGEFDIWSGRIVATVALPAAADSFALLADRRAKAPGGSDVPFAAAAFRYPLARDSARAAGCAGDIPPPDISARADSVSDSLRTVLLADTATAAPPYRLAPRVVTSRLTGCFGAPRLLLLAALRSGGDLLTREHAVLIDADGSVTPVPVHDFRFRAHLMLHVLDADGDGIDDVVARGYGRRVGSLVVLRFDPEAETLTRLTGGFAYEGL